MIDADRLSVHEHALKMLPALCKSIVILLVTVSLMLSPAYCDEANSQECSDVSNCVSDTLGFEAVKQLHVLIDDDHNGNLDRDESDGFFRDELKHDDGAARQEFFHGSDDLISINDLWKLWTLSEVYNWTVDEVIHWVEEDANLPKYIDSFRVNEVDGHILPRIAVNSQYVTSILGIKNPIHRQKLSIKATDLVLFGYKKRGHNWIKDLLLVSMLVVALTVAWLSRRDNKASQKHVRKVLAELESLQRSEDTLTKLQKEYEDTKKEHQEIAEDKQSLEKKLADEVSAAKAEAERLRTTREATEEEIQSLKLAELELIEVRKALAEAERRLEQVQSDLPQLVELQQWLQLTFEVETQYYEMKKETAEKYLQIAREMCERIHKKRSGLLGSLRVAHSTFMDDTDQSIMQARGALEEVQLHFQERNQRWQELERICGFDIIENPGLHVLETTLRGVGGTYIAGSGLATSASVSGFSTASSMHMDSEHEDDFTPAHMASVGLLTSQPSLYANRNYDSTSSLSKLYQSGNRTYPDRRVWPNLMKAGMQLTMFGLGLTNPQLGGAHRPSISCGQPADKRKSLVEAFGVSQNRSSARHAKTVPINLHKTDSFTSRTSITSSESNGTTGSQADVVKFGLGDPNPSPMGSPKLSHNFHTQSKSLDDTSKSVRPKSLPTSLSESSLKNLLRHSDQSTIPDSSTRRPKTKSVENPSVIREESTHSSTDSLELPLNGKEKKKTSLKTLIFKSKKKKE